MSFATQLLRILLVVALAISGPGMAAPQVAMPMAPAHAVAADHGCHDNAGMAHATLDNGDGVHRHEHPGRCSSADCHCACVHMLPVLSGVFAQMPVVARTVAIPPLAQRHPDVARAHLIRPPIG